MAHDDSMMPDPSLLLSEDRDKNVAEWLVGQIFGAETSATPAAAAVPESNAAPGELADLAHGLIAHYFGDSTPTN